MKKTMISLAVSGLCLALLAACGTTRNTGTASEAATGESAPEKPLQVMTTIFPEYDWARAVAGQDTPVQVTQLMDSGVDLHSYQATAQDLMAIHNCDVLIYVGGESSAWVEDALAGSPDGDRQVVNLLEVLGDTVKEEEVVEGMEAGDEDPHGHDDVHEAEADEHIWLSLKNAQQLLPAIAEAFARADAAHAETYRANAQAYCGQLAALDQEYNQAVQAGSGNTVLFADRFPLRYLVDDYGLRYYAAFPGCSAETEASFATVTFLAGKVDELGLHTILTLEDSDGKLAQTIAANTRSGDQTIAVMDSMQTTTSQAVAQGKSYLSIMKDNLAVLKAALL